MAIPKVSVILDAIDNASDKFAKVGKNGDGLKDKLLGVGKALGALAAAVGFGAWLKQGIEDAIEGEAALATFRQTLRNVGRTYEEVEPSANAMYETLKKTSRFAQTDMQVALDILTAKTGSYDKALGAMQLTANVAAKDHSTMGEAAEKVAKILNGVGSRELKQYGITTTNVSEAVAELSARLNGQAENELTTMGGKLAQLKERWSEFGEAVGAAIISNDALSGSTGGVTGTLIELEKWVKENEEGISGFVDALIFMGTMVVHAFDSVAGIVTGSISRSQAVFILGINIMKAKVGEFLELIGTVAEVGSDILAKVGIKFGAELARDLKKTGAEMKSAAEVQIDVGKNLFKLATEDSLRFLDLRKFHREKDATGEKEHTERMKDLAAQRVFNAGEAQKAEQAQLEKARTAMRVFEEKAAKETADKVKLLETEIMKLIGEMLPPMIATTTGAIDRLAESGSKALDPTRVISWQNALKDAGAVLDPISGKYKLLKEDGTEITERSEETADSTAKTAISVAKVADGVLGAASSFGIISKETENALSNVIDIADNIPALLTGDPSAILSVAGSLGSVLTGVFGTSADERERRRALKEVADGLEELARTNRGLLDLNAPGKDIRAAQQVLPEFIKSVEAQLKAGAQGDHLTARKEAEKQAQLLAQAGLTKSQLFAMAQDMFGIDIAKTGLGGLKGFLESLGIITGGSPFGTGFGGEMERIRRQAANKGDDADQFKLTETEKALKKFGGSGIGELLASGDLASVFDLTSDELTALAGGLSISELFDAIQEIIDLRRDSEGLEDIPAPSIGDAASSGLPAGAASDSLPSESLPGVGDNVIAREGGVATSIVFENVYVGAGTDRDQARHVALGLMEGAAEGLNKYFGQELRIEDLQLGRQVLQ